MRRREFGLKLLSLGLFVGTVLRCGLNSKEGREGWKAASCRG
jgi:hypothetical protein